MLINNAGGAEGLDTIAEGKDQDWETMMQTNVLGVLRVTRAALPLLVNNPGSSIINIGSLAARVAYEGGAAYCAAKAGELQITRALRLELNGTGLRVSSIDPGLAETEFSLVRFKGDTARAAKVYEGMVPLTAEDIAETLVWIASRPPHVNIDEVLIKPTDQAAIHKVYSARKTVKETKSNLWPTPYQPTAKNSARQSCRCFFASSCFHSLVSLSLLRCCRGGQIRPHAYEAAVVFAAFWAFVGAWMVSRFCPIALSAPREFTGILFGDRRRFVRWRDVAAARTFQFFNLPLAADLFGHRQQGHLAAPVPVPQGRVSRGSAAARAAGQSAVETSALIPAHLPRQSFRAKAGHPPRFARHSITAPTA